MEQETTQDEQVQLGKVLGEHGLMTLEAVIEAMEKQGATRAIMHITKDPKTSEWTLVVDMASGDFNGCTAIGVTDKDGKMLKTLGEYLDSRGLAMVKIEAVRENPFDWGFWLLEPSTSVTGMNLTRQLPANVN